MNGAAIVAGSIRRPSTTPTPVSPPSSKETTLRPIMPIQLPTSEPAYASWIRRRLRLCATPRSAASGVRKRSVTRRIV